MKLGVQPDRVLQSMLNDRMVAKGLILQYATTFFQDYLFSESIDDLVALLRKARLDTHLLDLFPPQKRTLTDLDEHFKVGRSSSCLRRLFTFQIRGSAGAQESRDKDERGFVKESMQPGQTRACAARPDASSPLCFQDQFFLRFRMSDVAFMAIEGYLKLA